MIASFVVGLTKLTDDIWALNVASYILPIFVLIYAFKFNIIQASDIGLTWKINGYVTSQKKIILIGFFVFSGIMIYMFVGFLTRMVFPENLFEFGVDSEFTSEQLWIRFLLAIVYSAWAGVIEESYYRGILKKVLEKFAWPGGYIVLSSLLFSIIHFRDGIYSMIPLFFLGLFYSYYYVKFNSLTPAILAHIFHDLIAYLPFIFNRQ